MSLVLAMNRRISLWTRNQVVARYSQGFTLPTSIAMQLEMSLAEKGTMSIAKIYPIAREAVVHLALRPEAIPPFFCRYSVYVTTPCLRWTAKPHRCLARSRCFLEGTTRMLYRVGIPICTRYVLHVTNFHSSFSQPQTERPPKGTPMCWVPTTSPPLNRPKSIVEGVSFCEYTP